MASSLEGGCNGAKVGVAAQHDGDEVAGAPDGRVHATLQPQQVWQAGCMRPAHTQATTMSHCDVVGVLSDGGLTAWLPSCDALP